MLGAAFVAAAIVSSPVSAQMLNTLVTFDISNNKPSGGLIADANGNLFGTTFNDGVYSDGTVFEIAKTASGYASTPSSW